jgi:hypothetical protein
MFLNNRKEKWQSLAGLENKINENVVPEESVIQEGRYDETVGKTVDMLWRFIKDSKKK